METLWTILALAFSVGWTLGVLALVIGVLALPFLLALLDWRASGRRRPRAT
jgi:hypothetical protein